MNAIFLVGNMGKDPEVRRSEKGTTIACFSLATSRYESGKEETDWHQVVVIGKAADHVEKYYRKGMKLAVTGQMVYRKFEDRNGVARTMSEVKTFERPEWVGGVKIGHAEDEKAFAEHEKQKAENTVDNIPF